jgi:hypothetical protein
MTSEAAVRRTSTSPKARSGRLAQLLIVLSAFTVLGAAVAACGVDTRLTAEEQALLDDPRYGTESALGADYGGHIAVDERSLSIIPTGDGGDTAVLSFYYFGDTDEIQDELSNVEVHDGSVVGFRNYRIRVTSISDRGISIQLATLTE